MAEIWTNEQDFHWQNDFDPYGKRQSGGVGNGGDDNGDEGGGSGFGVMAKLILFGFVLSGLSGVLERLSIFDVDWNPDPPPITDRLLPKINYLDLMLPAEGFTAARNRRPQKAKTTVMIDNQSQDGLVIYRLRSQHDDTNPGPLVREATVAGKSNLEIVCHVDQVFTVVRENGNMLGYIAADSKPGVFQVSSKLTL